MINTKIERRQLSVQVAERLRESIANGDYLVGKRLPPEPQLMTELGVGRSTIREAVQALAHAGILEVRQGSGTFVRARPADMEPLGRMLRRVEIAQVHEARRAIEVEIASLAAQRRDDSDLVAMREALNRREACRVAGDDARSLVDADLDFHTAIARACGNIVLEDLYCSFAAAIRESLVHLVQDDGSDEAQAALHEQLYHAIANHDAMAAARAAGTLLGGILAHVSQEAHLAKEGQ